MLFITKIFDKQKEAKSIKIRPEIERDYFKYLSFLIYNDETDSETLYSCDDLLKMHYRENNVNGIAVVDYMIIFYIFTKEAYELQNYLKITHNFYYKLPRIDIPNNKANLYSHSSGIADDLHQDALGYFYSVWQLLYEGLINQLDTIYKDNERVVLRRIDFIELDDGNITDVYSDDGREFKIIGNLDVYLAKASLDLV